MQKLQDFLIMMTLTDRIEPPVFQDKCEQQLTFMAAISIWLNFVALVASYWQDQWLPVGQVFSPVTILLLVSLLIISWLNRHYFRRHFPIQITPLKDTTEVAYCRRQVLKRLLYDILSFLIVFLILWGRLYFSQPHLTRIFLTNLAWTLFGVCIGLAFKYDKLMACYTLPKIKQKM